MVNFENKARYGVYDLKELVSLLRAPGGCPWDIEQTHKSIRRNLLEEAYEAAEAIDSGDTEHLREELGDVLMQVVFHSDIEETEGRFTLDDAADTACKKLIFRHPHVFGDAPVSGSGEVLQNWDKLKQSEKNHETVADAMKSVARSLPALWRAEKIQKKASKVGLDWPDIKGALDALRSELAELEDAVKSGENIGEELGDVLFSAVNVARFLSVDPEQALGASCDKFTARFEYVENAASRLGKRLEDMTLSEMDALYDDAKAALENICDGDSRTVL